MEGVPVVSRREQLLCGMEVVDLRTGGHAARLEFRPEKDLLRPYYHWSDKVAAPLVFDEYDYETDDPARTPIAPES